MWNNAIGIGFEGNHPGDQNVRRLDYHPGKLRNRMMTSRRGRQPKRRHYSAANRRICVVEELSTAI
jgi:hypothetical protein